jgi:molybdate transport system substrate-binding protein
MKPTAPLVAGLLGLLLSSAACTPAPGATPGPEGGQLEPSEGSVRLDVFAAASLSEAFTELGSGYEASHPGVRVAFNFAGSNQLAQQIGQGARADVFASANASQMEVVIAAGRVNRAAVQTFAQNRLVVIYPAANAPLAGLEDLADPGLKLVLAATEVPAGRYSLDFLDRAALEPEYGHTFRAAVLANVVSFEENVRAVLTKVALGEADAGIVYASDTIGLEPGMIGHLVIPDPLNPAARYPIAALADSASPDLAQAFVRLVLSAEGQSVLARFGFVPMK